MIDHCKVLTRNSAETQKTGSSLAGTLYKKNTAIALYGELGSGKTVFSKGLASVYGNTEPVRIISPTFALKQEYGDKVLHIDLFRLKPEQTREIILESEDFPGIRIIEWADRALGLIDEDISVKILENGNTKNQRIITFEFSDIRLPSQDEIDQWRREVLLPEHIIRHNDVVAEVCDKLADLLIERQMVIRKKALTVAAKTHDLLRFIDFRSEKENWSDATDEERKIWRNLKNRFPGSHEAAAADFLADRGYPEIGAIVGPHRGYSDNPDNLPRTNEQLVLSYADKRVLVDKIVTLEERFDYFAKHYAGGKETPFARNWFREMRESERRLFPGGPPF